MTKFIFVTGGVVSSLGKGLAAASLAALLQARGFKVRIRKFDPYLNVDPGTMSPFQHGEVFVTDDGAETDLDLGHYERFTDVSANQYDSTTSGKIYSRVIAKERRGDYLGATVMVVPHVIDEIKSAMISNLADEDFVICEIGGTIGDIEGLPYVEAIRQLGYDLGRENVLYIHLTLVPYIPTSGELKTKPTQHSVKDLLSLGVQPDILLCRSDRSIPEDVKSKIGLYCNIASDRVIAAVDADTIYQVPLNFYEQGLDLEVCEYFKQHTSKPDLSKWHNIVQRIRQPEHTVKVGVVGKYTQLLDAYKSLSEALSHGGIANNAKVKIEWLDSENRDDLEAKLSKVDAVLVPGGFGERGIQGKINAIEWARLNNVPFFGICMGMQMAVIEAARNLLKLEHASSTEFGHTNEPVVALMTEWMDSKTLQKRRAGTDMGGTMRLGAYPCALAGGSKIMEIYQGASEISERHRHRYEVNAAYQAPLRNYGYKFSGMSPDGDLPEILELEGHPWFIGVQFHPELKSRPFSPHPLFKSFIHAALQHMAIRNSS